MTFRCGFRSRIEILSTQNTILFSTKSQIINLSPPQKIIHVHGAVRHVFVPRPPLFENQQQNHFLTHDRIIKFAIYCQLLLIYFY